ncbi:MAG: hypothetical protein BJ554DRAFT_5482 [Olpidium bornovanus]|uniref:Uncharacterized protein n=1 Tax=Olpidium bornovanus TaxID=278681 RepID=A0A8H8DL17_9FUNG|nr:MAG: hypothetical protein BJ554DRAFT_5482 [Olpidium bornovanus]
MADGVNDAEAGSPSDLPALVGGGPGGRDYQARPDRDAELGRDDGQLARPFDVATILNELTMDEPWTAAAADDDDDGGPLRLDPAAAAAAAAAAGDSDGDLGVPPNPPPPSSGPPAASAADRRGSAGVAEPAGSAARPASPNSPSFVEVSLNAWSDGGGGGVRSPPSHRHHASSAHAFSNPFSASAALPAVRRSSSGVGHSNPWAATSPVNKDTIVGASADDLGPFVNVSPDDHDFRYAGRRGSLSHALAGHGAGNLRRSMSASSAAAATIPEDVELAEKRSVSSSR